MIVYKCVITGDEMFSDGYKFTLTEDGMMYEVTGKLITRSEGIDDALIGGNASAEGLDEGSESSSVSGVNIVIDFKLQEAAAFDKKSYGSHIKAYLKEIKAKLEESDPERASALMAGAPKRVKDIMSNVDKYQYFTGESMNPDGMHALLDYREDGVTPYMLFFKDGLLAEKF